MRRHYDQDNEDGVCAYAAGCGLMFGGCDVGTRNGGHIMPPPLYHDHLDLKKKHSAEVVKQIIKWFNGAKEKLWRYLEELSSEKDTTDGPKGMQLVDGCTHTPCLSIHDNIVHMPYGDIRAKHFIHTTNGWTSHLIAPMQEKNVPVRGHMTAQRARIGLEYGWLVPTLALPMSTLIGAHPMPDIEWLLYRFTHTRKKGYQDFWLVSRRLYKRPDWSSATPPPARSLHVHLQLLDVVSSTREVLCQHFRKGFNVPTLV
ncbi:hypothetical protein ARMSODRAFT_1069226 [Armillaria solidipes]|uniref:Uncharacterized protein n=1 Tax=Armillaria solidipes TaxID=1076256 RepID=A0A2H3BAE4_9AGAR|nr:hypothetical protein ARMSODRAFT_1069226 [Armillaria solidipes]